MTGPSTDDAARVYQFLVEYMTAKGFPPSLREIAQAVNWGNRSSHLYLATKAVRALQEEGKIRVSPAPTSCRSNITLVGLPTQQITSTMADTGALSVKPAMPKAGQIICAQCRNPVCAKSKCLCSRHLQLAREATRRSAGYYIGKFSPDPVAPSAAPACAPALRTGS